MRFGTERVTSTGLLKDMIPVEGTYSALHNNQHPWYWLGFIFPMKVKRNTNEWTWFWSETCKSYQRCYPYGGEYCKYQHYWEFLCFILLHKRELVCIINTWWSFQRNDKLSVILHIHSNCILCQVNEYSKVLYKRIFKLCIHL